MPPPHLPAIDTEGRCLGGICLIFVGVKPFSPIADSADAPSADYDIDTLLNAIPAFFRFTLLGRSKGTAPAATGRYQMSSSRSVYAMYIAEARSVNRNRKGNTDSTKDLVETHLFYVIQVAKEYRNLGIAFEDLLAEGNLGLMEAAERFDRTRGVKFISYATWWIRKRMWDLVARQVSLVRIPKYRLDRLRRVRQVERELRGSLGRVPSVEEISRVSGLTITEVESLNGHPQREISLETIVNMDSGTRLEEIVAEATACPPDGNLARESSEMSLLRSLEHLPTRQREILSMHYGIGGRRPATLAEIGRRLGVSRERVRQLERQGLVRLRRIMETENRYATA